MNLIFQGRKTAAFYKLLEGQTAGGASVVRRQKGFSDYDIIRNLVAAKWLEPRPAGPRGGIRYFTTVEGAAALAFSGCSCIV